MRSPWMPVCLWAVMVLATADGRCAESGQIETIAGTGQPENNGDAGAGREVNVGDPFGVELGPDGALYIAEVRNHRIRRLDLETGRLTTMAGTGVGGYSGDGGPATKAQLKEPYELRFDKQGSSRRLPGRASPDLRAMADRRSWPA
jgi:streptogramin lyase